MEIRIGVRNIAREIVIESTDSADQVRELITNARRLRQLSPANTRQPVTASLERVGP